MSIQKKKKKVTQPKWVGTWRGGVFLELALGSSFFSHNLIFASSGSDFSIVGEALCRLTFCFGGIVLWDCARLQGALGSCFGLALFVLCVRLGASTFYLQRSAV